MLHSMTAFARRRADTPALQLVWELRSVNHRYLETQFRMPEQLRSLEGALREQARRQLQRGKLDCSLRAESKAEAGVTELNRPLMLKLLAVLEQVRRDAPEIRSPNPMDLLRWPGMLGEPAAMDPEQCGAVVVELFGEALGALIEERRREGRELQGAIATRLDAVGETVGELQGVAASIVQDVQNRLNARLGELAADVDPGRLEQEVALLAQKADVAEELDRLSIHVAEAKAHQHGPGPHGRRLDFLCQELMREANTLAAKSLMPEMSTRAVDLKVIIEQIREQVQNVE